MGIPSYYKKLIDTIPGLISKEPKDIHWLFMDFNCLIYHCIDHVQMEYSKEKHNEWETAFIECIIIYCLKVIKEVNPTGVFIAIDGVVPMAKMRQQRLRRFKSAWMSKDKMDTWDKNSITPGTLFMTRLRIALEKMISKHDNWILSSSDEPGEGEHKIIAEWRKGYKGNYAVYGLDADLIVLSMLGHELYGLNNIWLFREEIHAGKVVYNSLGEVFNWFSINALKNWISLDRAFILNYCFAMSILGNDFLPSSLGLKMRDDGHSELLRILKTLSPLVDSTLTISIDGMLELFHTLLINEPTRICKYITKKQMFANNADELNIGENNWPLSNIEESILVENRKMCPKWQEKYLTFFNGTTIDNLCKEYLYGIQWIWAYYTGNDICYNWYYPHSIPPLWEWIHAYLIRNKLPAFSEILVKATDIKPVEQLALVLPLESWSLVTGKERSLPLFAPQYYPESFSFESVGKRFFWECEAMIPIPSILEVKRIMKV